MDELQKAELYKKLKLKVCDCIIPGKLHTDDEIMDTITETVFQFSRENYISIREKQEIINRIFNSMRRLDILQPIIEDKSITEIMINGPDCIFIERKGKLSRLDLSFESSERLEDVIQNIVSKVNRVVNESSPIVDARLEDGSRINAVLPPIALNGPILTIRKFPERSISMEDLIGFGSITREAAGFLEGLVKARYNIFISGGTGSGKTTFLNVLSNFIPGDERIITIEDSAELQITGIDNLVRLETRNTNTEGKGEITIRELIKTSLRMRPDRIIVGEVRGIEAMDMLVAMNTGHDGSLCTGHANSSKDMLSRLETMILAGAALPLQAIRQQITSAIDIIVHLSRVRDKSRKVMEISEVAGYADGEILMNPLFVFEAEGGEDTESVKGTLKKTGKTMINTGKLKMYGMEELGL